jgi:N-acetylglucosaminyldiphosphoundecaprenol N-acetyl-beta-D-mannosaminyltransferase
MIMKTRIQYDPSVQVILGIPFNNVSFPEAVEWVHQRVVSQTPGYIATANLDFVRLAWEDPELQRILLEADLVVADGFPIVWLSRLFGPTLKERVTGSDLVPMLSEMAARNGHSLFLLGGAPGVGEKAADTLKKRFPGIRIAGQYSPPMADVISMNHSDIINRLEAAHPDILLVAFGAPKQEKFANMHVRTWTVPVSIGVGGTLDFLAGTQIRAPRFIQKLSLEWLWRCMTAPRRLARRYVADLVFLLTTCWRLLKLRMLPDRAAGADSSQIMEGDTSLDIRWATYTSQDTAGLPLLFPSAATHSIALDIRGTSWLSSTELGSLLQLAKACRLHEHRLILYHAGTRVTRLLSTCGLMNYLELAESRTDAQSLLAHLAPSSQRGRACRNDSNQLIIITPREITATNLSDFKEVLEPEFSSPNPCSTWIVDLQHTKFVDSSALGLFSAWRQRAAQAAIPLTFINASKPVAQTFRIAKVDSWLDSAQN